jgi:hypothetical protein
VVFDSRASVSFNQDYDQLSFGLHLAMHELQTLDMNIVYDISEKAMNSPLAVFGAPQVVNLSFEMYDDQFTPALIEECATISGLEKTAIIDKQVAQLETMALTQFNVQLSDAMKQQLRQYITDPSHLTISIDPREPVELMAMAHYKSTDVPALLNLSIENTTDVEPM